MDLKEKRAPTEVIKTIPDSDVRMVLEAAVPYETDRETALAKMAEVLDQIPPDKKMASEDVVTFFREMAGTCGKAASVLTAGDWKNPQDFDTQYRSAANYLATEYAFFTVEAEASERGKCSI